MSNLLGIKEKLKNSILLIYGMHQKLLNMLLEENEITWQSIIYNLIKTEEMDPWDIDISLLTKRYIETVEELKKADFFISGKVLLAAAILLRIKSYKLVEEDIQNFDNLLFPPKEDIQELSKEEINFRNIEIPPLAIRTPQERKRKVSVEDLMRALEKALEVNRRRVKRRERFYSFTKPRLPERKISIANLIKIIFEKIKELFKKNKVVTFSKLTNSENKKDKIYTFVPLLHLDFQNKIELRQDKPYGEIYINLK